MLLQLVPESSISVDELWDKLLHAVIDELHRCGYVVAPDIGAELVDEHGFIQEYRIVPGPATLTGARDDRGSGSVGFLLSGEKFGFSEQGNAKDPTLWARLEALAESFEETFFIAAQIFDPERQS
ncbi:MAG: hypothetical protein JO044_00105 [Mycobacteriaceae bacterium]|nr:hypothetical protein [Mycobacteriaceae bacterium]MBV9640819.1 hypothetical protein [Mycobacteriaceae bacterium]